MTSDTEAKPVARVAFDHVETLNRVVVILEEFGLPPEGEVDQFEWLREQLSRRTNPSSIRNAALDEAAKVADHILMTKTTLDVQSVVDVTQAILALRANHEQG